MPAAAGATRRPYQDQLQVSLLRVLPPLSPLAVPGLGLQRVEGGAQQCQQAAAGQTGGQEAGAAGRGLQDHGGYHNYNNHNNYNSININNHFTNPQHHSSCGGAAEW